jgi:DNA-binding response OmpR family regulator
MAASILIIDDDDTVRDSCAVLLGALGFDVLTAPNGREGVGEFGRNRPDIVLTDVLMPQMDGIETIREIRRAAPGAKIIAMSGGGRTGFNYLLDQMHLLGADAVLEKPFTPDALAAALEAVSRGTVG